MKGILHLAQKYSRALNQYKVVLEQRNELLLKIESLLEEDCFCPLCGQESIHSDSGICFKCHEVVR